MESEYVINLLTMIIIGGITWWVKETWNELKRLRSKLDELPLIYQTKSASSEIKTEILTKLEKLTTIEIMLAHNYVSKSDFTDAIKSMEHKLDRIELSLSNKVDKT